MTALLETRDAERTFRVGHALFQTARTLKAVNGVSLRVDKGEILGLVGESGCGKSTLAKMLLGLLQPTAGEILFEGQPLYSIPRLERARRVQPIFQDPYSSLNPRQTVADIVSLPLRVHGVGRSSEQKKRVADILDLVGLARRYADSYPNQLSGGQRQRVAIARALVMRPELVICDEPTSALDVSVQSQILNLLLELRKELGVTYILISHNLAVVEHLATRVAVMYLGRIVEEKDTGSLFRQPEHPYTQALLDSVLTPEPGLGIPDSQLGVAFPNPIDPPGGCAFHPRCRFALARCSTQPPLPVRTNGALVECHLSTERAAGRQPGSGIAATGVAASPQ
ncbi:MAG: ABC transporter ATP-binding protein [Burkholderiales bacterium]